MTNRPSLVLSLNETANSEADRLRTRLKSIADVTETVGGIAALIDALRRTGREPDVIVIELEGEPQDIFQALEMLKDHVPTVCAVYGFGKLNDVGFLRSLLALGFTDYFVSPFQDTALDEMSRMIATRDAGPQGPVIGFVSLAGGVGTSLVALNFAQFLAERSVADVALYHPQPDPYCTQFTGYDFDSIAKTRTARPILIKHDPALLDDHDSETDNDDQNNLIETHCARGNIVLVDLGTHVSERDILSRCDHLIIIGEPEYRSLFNAKSLNTFLSSQFPFAERHFALTKIGREGRIEFAGKDIQSLVDDQPILLYAYDPDAIASALAEPVPLLPVTLLKDERAFEKLSKRCRINLKPVTDAKPFRTGVFASLSSFLKKWKTANG